MDRQPWMDTAGGASDEMLHRRYVGPVDRWPISAAHQLAVLKAEGLHPQSHLVDVGCGPLCAGSLLIPWLDPGCYVGIEPNVDALLAGVEAEGLEEVIAVRRASFAIGTVTDLPELVADRRVWPRPDMVLMHSIFSHMRPALMVESLRALKQAFSTGTVVIASFALSRIDDPALDDGDQWEYPGLVHYHRTRIDGYGAQTGWTVKWLPYREPGKQVWARLT